MNAFCPHLENQGPSLRWASELTGLRAEELVRAQAEVRELEIPHLTATLGSAEDLDALVGSWLLTDSIDRLRQLGASEPALRKKLRDNPDIWPTWAEIVAGPILADVFGATEAVLEPGRNEGTHPDYGFDGPSGRAFVEFKALGFSQAETTFCRRFAPRLPAVCPPEGFVTMLAHPEAPEEALELPRGFEDDARRRMSALPERLQGLSGAQVIMTETRALHAARVREAVEGALRQLIGRDNAWVALHWAGGGTITDAAVALTEMKLPRNIEGVIFVGAAVLLADPRIHRFATAIRRAGRGSSDFIPDLDIKSSAPDDTRLVLVALEASPRVRTLLVRAQTGEPNGFTTLLHRTDRSIDPFALWTSRTPDL